MGRGFVLAVLPAVLIGCCPLGTTQTDRSNRPAVSTGASGLGLDEARQDCARARTGVLEMWRDQCRNPGMTEAQIRDRAEPMAARYGALLSDADLATDCAKLIAGRGGYADFARARGAQLEDICLDDLGFRPVSRPQTSCRQIGF